MSRPRCHAVICWIRAGLHADDLHYQLPHYLTCFGVWRRAEVHTLAIPESKDDIKSFLKRNVKFGGDAGIKVRKALQHAYCSIVQVSAGLRCGATYVNTCLIAVGRLRTCNDGCGWRCRMVLLPQ